MKLSTRIIPFTLVLLLAACNMPGAPVAEGPSAEDLAATIVAATMNAASRATSTSAATTPFASPVAPAITPTVKPTVSVKNSNAKCYSGPADDADVVATFGAGTTVDMLGKDTADGYWIVQDPTSHDLCWIQAKDVTTEGNFAALPEMTAAASTSTSAQQKAPVRPAFVGYSFQCTYSANGRPGVVVDLSWPDKADNEVGYRVYRDGTQVADLPADSTSYSDTTTIASGAVLVYQVAAYNDIGTSPQATTSGGDPITCQ